MSSCSLSARSQQRAVGSRLPPIRPSVAKEHAQHIAMVRTPSFEVRTTYVSAIALCHFQSNITYTRVAADSSHLHSLFFDPSSDL